MTVPSAHERPHRARTSTPSNTYNGDCEPGLPPTSGSDPTNGQRCPQTPPKSCRNPSQKSGSRSICRGADIGCRMGGQLCSVMSPWCVQGMLRFVVPPPPVSGFSVVSHSGERQVQTSQFYAVRGNKEAAISGGAHKLGGEPRSPVSGVPLPLVSPPPAAAMCTGDCSKFIGVSLYPFCALCIICNILLLFPGWTTEAVSDPQEKLTPEVLYLGGFFGSGFLVLIPAICIQFTGRRGKCNNRCGMLVSIALAAVAICGSLYGFVTSLLGLIHGPQCYYKFINGQQHWTSPFKLDREFIALESSYLFHRESWSRCTIPVGVVEFNVIFFATIMVASAIQVVLCTIQMINGLFGVLCGTCQRRLY